MVEQIAVSADSAFESLLKEFQQCVHPTLLTAPRLDWREVDMRFIRYLIKHGTGTPWINHLALAVVVMTAHTRLDRGTVREHLYVMHARWRTIFPTYGLTTFDEWKPVEHLPRYLNDVKLTDTREMRQEFLYVYSSSAYHTHAYLRSLPASEQEVYQQWVIPLLPPDLHRQLSHRADVQETQALRRKQETDAVVPHFALIRGQAHLRWNQLKRLQTKVDEAVALVQSGQEGLPLAFSYEETEKKQSLHFILWDRPSFVLAHAEKYSETQQFYARHRKETFGPERNHYFLEFVRGRPLPDASAPPDPNALLWFGDLLYYDVLCKGSIVGNEEEVERKQAFLHSWGYKAEGQDSTPFHTGAAGLLAWPHIGGAASFMPSAQKKTGKRLLLVESLFAAATFGLAALDFFTTTGARMSELLQVSLTPECLYTLEVEGNQRLLVRLVPKGTDKPADYIVGSETRRNFEKVGRLLQDHYHLQPGEPLPSVNFSEHNARSHQFPGRRPYLFQFGGHHLQGQAITACMRFLCHGMVFQTPGGQIVTLKAHLLRHVFATHIHHVEQVPLDVVAVILHQKDVRVTRYYAAPPWQQVVASANSLLDRFATHLGNIDEAFVRAPAEMQQQYEDAKRQVGTLAKVPGGDCTCHAVCPISFACTGCVFKVPDPARRDEVLEQKQWSLIRYDQVKRRGLGPEMVKMQALIQRCDVELQEMTMIEIYRKDETYAPTITIERDEQQTEAAEAVAPEALRGETSADGHARQGRRRSTRQGKANSDD